jgi:uncharacterized protein (UPF0179 family)
MTTQLWEVGKYYKFKIRDKETNRMSLYNGQVLAVEGEQIQILDKYNAKVTFQKGEIVTSAEQLSGRNAPAYDN